MRRIDHACLFLSGVFGEGIYWNLGAFSTNHEPRFFKMRLEKSCSYPALMSRNFSTNTSKSMAAGESKSNSFLNAFRDCSGVSGL